MHCREGPTSIIASGSRLTDYCCHKHYGGPREEPFKGDELALLHPYRLHESCEPEHGKGQFNSNDQHRFQKNGGTFRRFQRIFEEVEFQR